MRRCSRRCPCGRPGARGGRWPSPGCSCRPAACRTRRPPGTRAAASTGWANWPRARRGSKTPGMAQRLGVNVDHVATLRQARRVSYPDPVTAAAIAELAGAEQITIHLREDRRHIQDRDLRIMRETCQTILNLEMAATQEMVKIAYEYKPDVVTLVPERREEVTTEGGLDVNSQRENLRKLVKNL